MPEPTEEELAKLAKLKEATADSAKMLAIKRDTGSEADLFLLIETFGHMIWRLEHDLSDGRLPGGPAEHEAMDEVIEKMREDQTSIILALKRFGLDKPLEENGAPTEDYWIWYRWWKEYFETLTDEEWEVFDEKVRKGEDLSAYKPEGTWKELLPQAGTEDEEKGELVDADEKGESDEEVDEEKHLQE